MGHAIRERYGVNPVTSQIFGHWQGTTLSLFGETGADLPEKPRHVDRLCVEIGAADRDALVAIARQGMGGERDDRNLGRRGVRFDAPRRLPAVHFSKGDVHEDEVGPFGVRHRDAAERVDGKTEVEALALQPSAQHVTVHLIVFDQQDLRHWRVVPRTKVVEACAERAAVAIGLTGRSIAAGKIVAVKV
jgi:hypothetical protein